MENSIDDIIHTLPLVIHGYRFTEVIGRGQYAGVFKVQQIETGYIFASKVFHCSFKQTNRYEAIKSGTDCLMRLLHPNIIKIYDRFRENDFIFLILEYCSKGTIENYIESHPSFTESQIIGVMKELLSAVQYCHEQGIPHRDIRPSNILVTDNGILKMTDFGIGLQLVENGSNLNSNSSFYYKPPEIIRMEDYDPFSADMWSLGVTFYYIVTGSLPWNTTTDYEKDILNGCYKFPFNMPQSIIEIIRRLIVVDPKSRATAKQLLSNDIFSAIRINSMQFAPLKNDKSAPLCFLAQRVSLSNRNISRFVPRLSVPTIKMNKKLTKNVKNTGAMKKNGQSPIVFYN